MRVLIGSIICAICLVAFGLVTSASGPAFWTVSTAADFLKGSSDGVSISADGVLTGGPQLTNRLTSSPAQVWSVAESADGAIWAGTGGDGRLLRIRPGQPDETVFDADEANIFAVTTSGTKVYFATSPDGRVYVIDGASAPRVFFDPGEKYIWALAVDSTGKLWVGAGTPAVVYRVEADGTGKALYKPPAGHVVALARESNGRMLAGTEAPGRLYRFGPDDRPFALLDSGLTELRAIATGSDGAVFAAALQRGDDSGAAASGGTGSAAAAMAVTPKPGETPSPSPSPTTRSSLFRIDASGNWDTIWETTDLIYDIAAGDNESLLIATGPEGRLYRLERGRDVVLVTGVDAKQITRFAAAPKPGARLATVATANPGRVLAPAATDRSPATFTSAVRDTKSRSSWGQIRWESSGQVALFTRSGNTAVPDESWSDWSGPHAAKQGELIKSPAARFLQWKAVLTRGAEATPPQLTSVTVAYLPGNGKPSVTSITIHPPGAVFQRSFSSEDGAIAGLDDAVALARRPPGEPEASAPSPGRRMYQKGLQTIAWKAEDPDNDRLSYALQFRREGETAWRNLRTDLLDSLFVWDTASVPDGRYFIRVIASDAAGNAIERALTGNRESEAFDIDNTPPQITVAATRVGTTARLSVDVRDAQSPIQKLEYSIAGGPWQLVYPADGLADSPQEHYDIVLPAGADPARVVIRATDQMQNVASATGGR